MKIIGLNGDENGLNGVQNSPIDLVDSDDLEMTLSRAVQKINIYLNSL